MLIDADSPPLSRRERSRQDRREAIVAVAAHSFLEHGYAGTTMSGIAAALGGSKGTLWSYFASKEALFEAVIDHVTRTFRERLSALLDPCGDLSSTLERFTAGLLGRLTSPEGLALYRLVIAEAGRFPEMGRIFFNRAPLLTQRLLADFLEVAMDRGQMQRTDPLSAARLLIAVAVAGCHQQMLMGLIQEATSEMIAADVDRALTVFLKAFAPRSSD